MELNSKIYLAGHTGLVGSAIYRKLVSEGYSNIITKELDELNLINQIEVDEFFETEKPEYVFFAAGKVGGILANNTYPAEFIYQNVMMIFNSVNAAYENNVKKFLFLGSSCIYPKFAEQPIKENALLTGKLEETNKAYAVAKIAGIELCFSYNKQYKTDYICLMPTNMFGINDNYDLNNSHVVPAMIRKFHEAKIKNDKQVVLWGTGKPYREILCSDDFADGCLFMMNNYSGSEIVNIGSNYNVSIKELADIIKSITEYKGDIVFDTSKPDGTPLKKLDTSKAEKLGWKAKADVINDLKKTYADFSADYDRYIKKSV
ncbi:MAG: GDP-L-fucose synthase [Ignavibacteria bacterium]|nr:GDP-L-fucose synthase [Ignavibacteria bacterium]